MTNVLKMIRIKLELCLSFPDAADIKKMAIEHVGVYLCLAERRL
jgi:hypothetical protein